jgi:hypothetical protein
MKVRATTHLEPRTSAGVDNAWSERYLVRIVNEVDFDLAAAFT